MSLLFTIIAICRIVLQVNIILPGGGGALPYLGVAYSRCAAGQGVFLCFQL